MNSAPVQLLPVDTGSRYDNSLKEADLGSAALSEKDNGKFTEVFEKASGKQTASEPVEQAEAASESCKDGGTGKKVKAKKAVSGKKGELNPEEGKPAEKAGPLSVKPEEVVVKLKKNPGDDKLLSEKAVSDSVRKRVKEGADVKLSDEELSDSAAETGLAGSVLIDFLKDTDKAEDAKDSVSITGKSGEASGKNPVEPVSIKIVSSGAAEKNIIEAGFQKAFGKEQPAGADGKLRISDRRKTGSRTAFSKSVKNALSPESLQSDSPVSRSDSDFGSRLSELVNSDKNADVSKPDLKQADVKTVQSSVLTQLKEDLNSQIVKQAGIVVKGNGTGEIKLVMKPESLGKVRIQLSLNDNHIAGRIIVENNIVREIFESNLENLYKAFGSEGFENGGLEVSVQGQGGKSDGSGRRNGRSFGGRAVKAMEEAVPEVVNSEWRNNAVNMVV